MSTTNASKTGYVGRIETTQVRGVSVVRAGSFWEPRFDQAMLLEEAGIELATESVGSE